MIRITRNLARQLRAVFRRLAPRSMQAAVSLTAGIDGLHVRLHRSEILAEYHQSGEQPADTIVLPLDTFADFEGRNDGLVAVEVSGAVTQARWDDSGIPQVKEYEAEGKTKLANFPSKSDSLTANDPALLKALADASETAAKDQIRYAVNHIQLRGSDGSLVATDGRQLLVQAGFQWPWKDDLLIPASTVFASRELPQDQAVSIGKTGKHVVVVVGPWTFCLPTGEGRFPRIDEVVPRETNLKSHGRLDVEDSVFLAKVLPRLPGGEEENPPVTVDLNGQVCVRARANGKGPVTEAVLARSCVTDRPTRFVVNRCFLARALQLGLSEVHVVDAATPILFRDEKRKYVIMPLGKDGLIAPTEDAVRISSAASPTNNHHQSPKRRYTTLNEPQTNGSQNGHDAAATNDAATNGAGATTSNGTRRRKTKSTGLAALIEEAEALKKALRDAYSRSHLLLRDIKRQRRQSSVMQTALRTLKELQTVDR